MMRLFIALPLPADVCRSLILAQEVLRQATTGGRYVPQDNFHITLHFIGEHDHLSGAANACDSAVRGIRPILLRLGEFGRFKRGNSFTGVIDIGGDLDELNRLHETLLSALMEQGFPLAGGHKRLTPHITLARDLKPILPDHYDSLTLSASEGAAFTANRLYLYESQFVNGRMVYTPLHKVLF